MLTKQNFHQLIFQDMYTYYFTLVFYKATYNVLILKDEVNLIEQTIFHHN